jgi:hypothetical protein
MCSDAVSESTAGSTQRSLARRHGALPSSSGIVPSGNLLLVPREEGCGPLCIAIDPFRCEIERWSVWSLAEADRIAPVKTAHFSKVSSMTTQNKRGVKCGALYQMGFG